MPAVPPYIIDPIWEQFAVLLPERNVDHPLGCHRHLRKLQADHLVVGVPDDPLQRIHRPDLHPLVPPTA